MHLSFTAAILGPALLVSGAAIPNNTLAPALPLSAFPSHNHNVIHPSELFEALASKGIEVITKAPIVDFVKDRENKAKSTSKVARACSNPRVRVEWDSYSRDDRHAYLNAINCLRSKPASGKFPPAANRYEDLVRLHQSVTPNVHDNNKFVLWHRHFVWAFEDILRTECGFDRALPWWDEARNTGKFAASSVFSSEYYGAIAINGACVTDGVFANTNLNIGPGYGETAHCLSRAGDSSYTSQITEDLINAIFSWPNFPDFAYYLEGTVHAYGHLGIGAVQADKASSPGDPTFFLHHAYIDRLYANWQGGDAATRTTTISGTDINGNPLTVDTMIYLDGLRPDVRIGDVLDVLNDRLCYTYQY